MNVTPAAVTVIIVPWEWGSSCYLVMVRKCFRKVCNLGSGVGRWGWGSCEHEQEYLTVGYL